jgi:hypothetical protein
MGLRYNLRKRCTVKYYSLHVDKCSTVSNVGTRFEGGRGLDMDSEAITKDFRFKNVLPVHIKSHSQVFMYLLSR